MALLAGCYRKLCVRTCKVFARQPRVVFLDSIDIELNTFVPPKRRPERLSSSFGS